jgi:hypothetical protein
MQTATIRLFIHDEPSRWRLKSEAPLPRAKAMEVILAGFHAAREMEMDRDADDRPCRYMQWAGYQPYHAAAPLGQQHLTHVQLRPAVGACRFEYAFPGGLTTVECDDLCLYVIGEDEDTDRNDRERELLVTSTLAGVLHADGVSLADHVIAFAHGQTVTVAGRVIIPATPPTTLCATVRDLGWSATIDWLRDTQTTLERVLDTIRDDSAVWVPVSAPRSPWEPLVLQYHDGRDCLRLAMGAEAAVYAGYRMELAVSEAERADWFSDREAQRVADMSNGQWRRWIETNRDVRVGRPIGRDGQPARNRRLIHRADLRRALRLACRGDNGEEICNPQKCWMSCQKATDCPRRDRPKP